MKIEKADELDRILTAIGNEFMHANVVYKLYLDVNLSFEEYKAEVNESSAFWGITRDSLFDSVMLRLCRLYQKSSGAITLQSVLQEISANLYVFNEEHFRNRLKDNPGVDDLARASRTPVMKQLNIDIEFASEQNQPVKRLIRWRNSQFVHKSSKVVTRQTKVPAEYAITYGDISTLLEKGMKIVNRYTGMFRAVTYSLTRAAMPPFTLLVKTELDNLRNQQRQSRKELEYAYGESETRRTSTGKA